MAVHSTSSRSHPKSRGAIAMSTELRQALEQVARRFRHVRLWSGLALCWLTWAVLGLGLSVLLSRSGDASIRRGWLLASFAALAVTSGLACTLIALRSVRDRRWVARRIESKHLELGTGLHAGFQEGGASH